MLDADIHAFFDTIDHAWMMQFLEHRIADRRLLRLVRKWLVAGVIEGGRRIASERGCPQGAVISPVLANIYLHYVYDLWVRQWRKRYAKGDVIVGKVRASPRRLTFLVSPTSVARARTVCLNRPGNRGGQLV